MVDFQNRPPAPCNSQRQADVEAYYRNVKVGDQAVIRCTQGHFLEYHITKIAGTNPKRGRVYVEQGDAYGGAAYYAKNGKSCFHPTGQSNLVVPTEEVLSWSNANKNMIDTGNVNYNIIPPGQRSAE